MRNGKSFVKRMITGILSAAMILTAVPTYAYAEENLDTSEVQDEAVNINHDEKEEQLAEEIVNITDDNPVSVQEIDSEQQLDDLLDGVDEEYKIYFSWSYPAAITVTSPASIANKEINAGEEIEIDKDTTICFKVIADDGYEVTKVTATGIDDEIIELKADSDGLYKYTKSISGTTEIRIEMETNYCEDNKVKLTIEPSGFTKVEFKEEEIGTRECVVRVYRKDDNYDVNLGAWSYNFKNSDPGYVWWIFVSEDKKSWESRWTYKEIIKQSGTYYATLEIKDKTGYNGNVYKSDEFEYTVPAEKIDTPSNFRVETKADGDNAGDRYLYWDDVSTLDCVAYEYEAENSETNKKVNFLIWNPNEQFGYRLDNQYSYLGPGEWMIRVRALSNDINSKNVSDWAEYTYSMENSINCGDEDEENEKYYSIRPAYDYSYKLTQEEYSNIINKSGWQESENKYVERYIVKPGAQKVIVTISSRDKYIDPAKVTAKIGGKDADVSYKTNKYGTYEYTIKKSDNTAIDRDIVINPGEFVGVRTITFSVDNDDAVSRLCDIDMYNPSKDLKKKCVVQRVDNKITFSNIPVNEDFKFKAPIARGYKISSLKYNGSIISPSSGVYTISKDTNDAEVIITTASSGTYSIPVTPGNATVTWGNDSGAKNNLSSNKINTDYKKDVYLKVVRNKGYRIEGVTMKADGDSSDAELTAVDGSDADTKLFKLYEKDKTDDHNFRIATGAAITVKTTAKPAVKVTTSLKHDGEDSSDKLSISGGANVGTGDSAYYGATNKDIVLTYTLPDNKIMGEAKVTIGDYSITASPDNDEFKQSVNRSVYKWTLSKSLVEDAWDNGKIIQFDIATSSKKINISVSDTSSGKVKIYKYTKGNGYNSESDLIDKDKILTVPYMSETYLYVAVDPGAVIKSVKAGSTVLKTETETIGANKYVYYIVPAASLKNNVAITVETEDTKIKVDGFKYDKENNEWSVKQTAGTTARYKLTLTPKTGDYSRLVVKIPTVNSNASARIVEEKGNHYLEVSTFENNKLAVSPVTIIIDDKDNSAAAGIIMDGTVVVKPQNSALSVPNIKLSASTDIDMTFALTPDKKLSDVKNLYYVVTAEAANTVVDDPLKSSVKAYAAADAASIKLNLGKDESITYGNGHARRYKVSAYLVQVKEYTGNAATDISIDDNVFVSGNDSEINKVKTLNNQSTKNPYYETKLGLTKKTTSFISGEKDILLALPKYNSNTTFTELGYADIINDSGDLVEHTKETGGAKVLSIDDNAIKISDSSSLSAGKYTLRVWPKNPGNEYRLGEEARLSLTVKRAITSLSVSVPSAQIYKKPNSAATVKPTIIYNGGDKNNAPAVKKVTWSITDENENIISKDSPLYGKVTINKNNGTVTVAKDYVLSSNSNDNIFYIKATADDYEGNTEFDVSKPIEISSEAYTINSISLGTVSDPDSIDLSSELSSKALLDKLLYVNGEKVDMSLVTVKVNDSKNFTMQYIGNEYQITNIRKSGTYKITVTANDGGKSSKTINVKVREGSVTDSIFKVVDTIDSTNTYTLSDSTYTFNKAPQYISLDVLLESDSVTKTMPTISVKGASKVKEENIAVSDGNKKILTVRPTSNTITVDVTYKIGKVNKKDSYTISLPSRETYVKLAVPKSLSIWAKATNLTYSPVNFTTNSDLSGKYKLKFILTDSQMKSGCSEIEDAILTALNSSVGDVQLSEERTVPLTVTVDSESIPKGTYKVNAVLTKFVDDELGYIPVSDPVEFKIEAKVAKAPSAAIKTDVVSISKDSSDYKIIEFKSIKDNKTSGYISNVKVYNNNDKGDVNEFAKYFKADISSDDKLVLKWNVNEIPETIEAKDMTGWIQYTITGLDSTVTTVKCEKITVTLKE